MEDESMVIIKTTNQKMVLMSENIFFFSANIELKEMVSNMTTMTSGIEIEAKT
jgi:hypothetical protein